MSFIQLIFLLGSFLCLLLSVFQILLALGFPLGHLAWGGQYKKLPAKLRISSLVSCLLLLFAALVLLERGGVVRWLGKDWIFAVSSWAFVVIFGLSTLGNLASKSRSEKIVMTPIAIYLFFVFFLAAIRVLSGY